MKSAKSAFLVDDDEVDQEFFISALMQVEDVTLFNIASNGIEALNTLQHAAELPSMIFMDLEMPLMGGFECLREITRNPRTRDIPIFLLTTLANQHHRATQSGARGFIVKPNDELTLIRGIRQALALIQ